ncbi:amino acid kinase family protein [Jannaschia marina]|uniref:amino acid kinase family protein n=1 Tax=Jannaschia marina TaxID=2741674 RepID=UPI0015CCA6C5|nr:carbamate kinase [Jannaschia marina]
MRIVIALGRTSLIPNLSGSHEDAVETSLQSSLASISKIVREHELILCVGVSLTDMQPPANASAQARAAVPGQSRNQDVERVIERQLAGAILPEREVTSVAITVETELNDRQAAMRMTGPSYSKAEADSFAARHNWRISKDGDQWRRVVPVAAPHRILQSRPIHWLIDKGTVVICHNSGLPVSRDGNGRLRSVEAVVEEDLVWELLARDLEADLFVMATDTDAVYQDWDGPKRRAIRLASPDMLDAADFAGDTIGTKVTAACRFAESTGNAAAIGRLSEIVGIIAGEKGTTISPYVDGVTSHERRKGEGR